MKCPFNCLIKEDLLQFDDSIEHLIVTVNKDNHIHVHGPMKNEAILKRMLDAIATEMRRNNITYLPIPKQDKEQGVLFYDSAKSKSKKPQD